MTECGTCGAQGNEPHLSTDCATPTALSSQNIQRLVRLLWSRVGKAVNPWFTSSTIDAEHYSLAGNWNETQLHINRMLYRALFENEPITDALISQAFAFLDGAR